VQLVDDDGAEVALGEVGEIVVRPTRPSIIVQSYYREPEATAHAFRDCWFHTGDRGRFDEDGFLYFVDRKKDMIRRRGENISSWEIEQVVCRLPCVLDCAAYGVPSELSEDEVMVAVEPRAHADVDPAALLDHCQAHLPHFAVPRFVRFCAELPRTPSQRIEKHRLRDEGVTSDTWDREQHDYEVTR
jgi:crotonobetaine/carnitine-CoA ligase